MADGPTPFLIDLILAETLRSKEFGVPGKRSMPMLEDVVDKAVTGAPTTMRETGGLEMSGTSDG